MEARRRLLVYAAAVAAYAVLGAVLHRFWLMPLYSGDERLYIEAGRLYLSGTPPMDFNMEHPPLAKYIIGACVHALGPGASYLCPGFFTGLTAAAVAEAVYIATGDAGGPRRRCSRRSSSTPSTPLWPPFTSSTPTCWASPR